MQALSRFKGQRNTLRLKQRKKAPAHSVGHCKNFKRHGKLAEVLNGLV